MTIARPERLDPAIPKINKSLAAAFPYSKKRKCDRRCRSESRLSAVRHDHREGRVNGDKLGRLGRTSRTVLSFWSKLKIRGKGTIGEPLSLLIDKNVVQKHRDAGKAMSTRVVRGGSRDKTPRSFVKVEKGKTKPSDQLESISYDCEAALGQPDLTGFFEKVDKRVSTEDKNIPRDVNKEEDDRVDNVEIEKRKESRIKLEVAEISKDSPEAQRTIDESTKGVAGSLRPKGEPADKRTSGKLATAKRPRSSRIPRARFTGFSRLPLKCKIKESSTSRLGSVKSKTGIADDARRVATIAKTKPPMEEKIEDERLFDRSTWLVESAASKRNVSLEEKYSGIEADEEFTTSVDDSPRIVIGAGTGDTSIAALLRASKFSCSCRSCNDRDPTITKCRIKSDTWTDSRSSPEVGRYSESWRDARLRSRRLLAENSRSRGYPEFDATESDTVPTTRFDIYETNEKRISSVLPRPVVPFAKPRVVSNPSPRMTTGQRLRFSFFDTLFDIVFWPFLFLRADR